MLVLANSFHRIHATTESTNAGRNSFNGNMKNNIITGSGVAEDGKTTTTTSNDIEAPGPMFLPNPTLSISVKCPCCYHQLQISLDSIVSQVSANVGQSS